MISRTGPFIIEEYHLRGTTEFIREIYPHPVLGRPFWSGSPSTWIRLSSQWIYLLSRSSSFISWYSGFRYLSAQFMIQFAIVFVERSRSYLANSLPDVPERRRHTILLCMLLFFCSQQSDIVSGFPLIMLRFVLPVAFCNGIFPAVFLRHKTLYICRLPNVKISRRLSYTYNTSLIW